MKKIIFSIIIVIITISANAQWVRQVSGTTNAIRDIYFINLKTGWACGDNIIYKTTNGGINWITQPNPAISYISQIHAEDSNIVYAAGYFTILKTTNGGQNWIGIMTGTYGSGLPVFEGLYFLNAKTGWLCGSLQIRKTTDGGQTFDSTHINGEMTDIYFKNELEGVCTGEYTIFKTSNGGMNWNVINLPWQWQETFLRVSFINDFTGYVVGGGGITLKSTDFGSTWDSVGRIMTNQLIYSSIFTSSNIGYAGGTFGVLFKTTNGGRNWGFQDTNGVGHGFNRSFWGYNDTIVWAVGGGGKIIHTTTGGSWPVGINNIGEEIPDNFELFQNYPNPFNSTTNIEFNVIKKGYYSLEVLDITGRIINILHTGQLKTGMFRIPFAAIDLSSGIYFYRLTGETNFKVKKMAIVK